MLPAAGPSVILGSPASPRQYLLAHGWARCWGRINSADSPTDAGFSFLSNQEKSNVPLQLAHFSPAIATCQSCRPSLLPQQFRETALFLRMATRTRPKRKKKKTQTRKKSSTPKQKSLSRRLAVHHFAVLHRARDQSWSCHLLGNRRQFSAVHSPNPGRDHVACSPKMTGTALQVPQISQVGTTLDLHFLAS